MSKITKEDIKTVLDFQKHFKFGWTKEESKLLNKLSKSPNEVLSDEEVELFKGLTMKMMFKNHPTFNDELWDDPKRNAAKVLQEIEDKED